jgi:hypothetical protein
MLRLEAHIARLGIAPKVLPSSVVRVECAGQELVELFGEFRKSALRVCDYEVVVVRKEYSAMYLNC